MICNVNIYITDSNLLYLSNTPYINIDCGKFQSKHFESMSNRYGQTIYSYCQTFYFICFVIVPKSSLLPCYKFPFMPILYHFYIFRIII